MSIVLYLGKQMSPAEYKAHREKLGLTQAGLAALLGVTRKTINARENGSPITAEAAIALQSMVKTDGQRPGLAGKERSQVADT